MRRTMILTVLLLVSMGSSAVAPRRPAATNPGTITEFTTAISNDAILASVATGSDGNLWFTEYLGQRVGRMVFDVQIKRPGSTQFSAWKAGVTTLMERSFPTRAPGRISSGPRSVLPAIPAQSGYSAPVSITVQ